MPSDMNKSKIQFRSYNGDKILLLTKTQLEELLHNMVLEATKPQQSEIMELKTEIAQLRESQEILSRQHGSQ